MTRRQLAVFIASVRLMTRQDVCSVCRVSERSLSRWIKAGRFPKPVYLVPLVPRWIPDELDGWLARRSTATGTFRPQDNAKAG